MLSIIVCGGRNYADTPFVFQTLDQILMAYKDVAVIHGGATGADTLADRWAHVANVNPPKGCTCAMPLAVPAEWSTYGPNAGRIRNAKMLGILMGRMAPGHKIGVVAFPGGAGTRHMSEIAYRAGVKVVEPRRTGTHG